MIRVTGSRAAAVAVVVGSLAMVPSSLHDGPRSAVDVSAVAIATAEEPRRSDHAVEVDRVRGRDVATRTTTTATSDCDGCVATSSAVTVTYAKADGTARADNVAHAWSSCVGCESRTVSVQVVVLTRAATLRANNRSLAANIACVECTSTAAAYQLVVVSPHGRVFDDAALEELRRWARSAAEELGGTRTEQGLRAAPGSSTTHEALADLERQARKALGPVTTLRRDADLTRGRPTTGG